MVDICTRVHTDRVTSTLLRDMMSEGIVRYVVALEVSSFICSVPFDGACT